jgi:hypothetical protein
MVTITQDGKQVAVVEDSNAAFKWLLRHFDYAIRWGGYRVLGEDGKELPEYAELRKDVL